MKSLLIAIALFIWVSPANAQQKTPLFEPPVKNHSKAYKEQQKRRAELDRIQVLTYRKPKVIIRALPPLTDDEIHVADLVRANQLREGRLIPVLSRFDILVRHHYDYNFAGSTLGYRMLNGNQW